MQQLNSFVCSVESRVNAVLRDVQSIVSRLCDVNAEVAGFQVRVETQQAHTAHADLLIFPINDLHTVIATFNTDLIQRLAIAGVQLDAIRDDVIAAKAELEPSPSSECVFVAVDKLIAGLDNICRSIANSLKSLSVTLRSLQHTAIY